jgi:hypothetical protein
MPIPRLQCLMISKIIISEHRCRKSLSEVYSLQKSAEAVESHDNVH